jgi:hypothetical protein
MAAMMERMEETALSSISASSPISACCSVSPGRPEPVSQLNAPRDSSESIVHSVHVGANPVVRPIAIRSNGIPPPRALSPSQTLLCTFLI